MSGGGDGSDDEELEGRYLKWFHAWGTTRRD